MKSYEGRIFLYNEDVKNLYSEWYNERGSPTVIMSDGAYGVSGFRGDTKSPYQLKEWYVEHIKAWSRYVAPYTTLWFWNTEIGWAEVHPLLKDNGWVYKSCNIWDKGKSHIAGNLNTKTIRSFPIVTEVCVQYVRKSEYRKSNNLGMSVQEWLRNEWLRAGFSLSKANEVCGVKAAAVRKYLTLDHLWYMPSIEIFQKLSDYANLYGKTEGKPYFSKEYEELYKESLWECMRAKFRCPFGVTNVWSESQLRGSERLKSDGKVVHLNQKPLSLIKRIVEVSSDKGDVVWDPFGGLFTTAIACKELDRACYSSERNMSIFEVGCKRVEEFCDKGLLGKFERS